MLLVVKLAAQSYVPVKNDNRFVIAPKVTMGVYGFDLSAIRLTPGTRFSNAAIRDAAYLKELDPNRLLSRFYRHAGLPEKGKEYGGWESAGLSGHTMGHYLSAASMMYAATGDTLLLHRVQYAVEELAKCQRARKTGYIGAIPNEDSIFYKVSIGAIKSGGFDLNGGWAPWYTVHKIMAGLVDTYLYCNNKQALEVACNMADWAINLLKNLDEAQIQNMLRCEYGGMNDVLAFLYAITGKERYLQLSNRFFDDFVMEPLSRQIDALQNKHANTNIPKGVGAATRYIWTGGRTDSTIAAFMWHTIVDHHVYANGGIGNYEYLGPEDSLSSRLSDDNTETCPSYNMLKLTRQLFGLHPSAELGDYYESTLINHILASQNPETGMMCYFVPLRSGGIKEFSDKWHSFTCCVGSGIENHSKYGEGIFYQGVNDNSLYINLFLPATLDWREQQTKVTIQSSVLEGDDILIRIDPKNSRRFRLKLRKPGWSETWTVRVNNQKITTMPDEDGFLEIDRAWKPGDQVTYRLERKLHAVSMPDNPDRAAIYYGPVLLAGNLGDTIPDAVMGTPVLLTRDKDPGRWIRMTDPKQLLFRSSGVGQPVDVTLQPFYSTYKNYYNVYFDFFTQSDWKEKQTDYLAALALEKRLAQRTVDLFRIGEMQPERDHHLEAAGESYVSEAFNRHGREARAGGEFSFDMQLSGNGADSLMVTYIGADRNRKFDILIDDELLKTEQLSGGKADVFYTRTYAIPPDWQKAKKTVRVRFMANHGATAGRVFGVRTIK
ncbi:glycoside hydrolase family 127 protein [Niabella terrae]